MRRQMSFQCRLDFIVCRGTRMATASVCQLGTAMSLRQSLCQTLAFEDKPDRSTRYARGCQNSRRARGSNVSNDYQDACKSYTGARDRATVKMGQRVNIGLLGWAVGEVHGNDDLVEYCARLLYSDTGCGIAPESLRWPYSETRAGHGRLCRSSRLRSTRRRSDLSPGPGSSASTLTRHRDGL